ncbi:hypothetical protein DQ04_15731000 [Trypanosoma grayi]|uniref:hypothetical protein n=1 Tax=Trypanosoma grayi TaxID=71804 RepID=UPI0004F46DDF|nr:hypothetical protein DQ04_15731000 [Trypanosoma grayi]KEG06135.1 hypothetical protein DQ04_15731000 [Trypanosoma grayi]
MAIRSPIPLVQNRDFEMVVAEEVRNDGTAWVKAFSTPLGYIEPLDPQQPKYVRALMLFSGILAQPITGEEGHARCRLSYVALVHPMGLLPSFVVNMVLSAQMNALRKLQRFILEHPLATLAAPTAEGSGSPPRGAVVAASESTGRNTGTEKDVSQRVRATEDSVDKTGGNNNNGINNMQSTRNRKVSGVRSRLSLLKGRVVNRILSNL